MEDIYNTPKSDVPRPLIQVLVPVTRTFDQGDMRFAWLSGFCLITCRIGATDIKVTGQVRIGENLAENNDLVNGLERALDPAASLAGVNLTLILSALCRLPIEAPDQAPSLALLTKLKTMIERQTPIDLRQINEPTYYNGNPHRLAQILVNQARDHLIEIGKLELPRSRRMELKAALRAWREALVPVVVEQEMADLEN